LIFNSEKIKKLLENHPLTKDNSIVPSAVFLARSDKCKKEREYLEGLFSQAPEKKQKDWINRISREDEINHFSSWFEIMLYGWLKQLGEVEIEPKIDGKRPDFSIDLQGKKIFFEARVRMETISSSRKVSEHIFEGPFPEVFTKFIDPYELKSLLEEKINQHKNIYKSGYAYIICIYLASVWESVEEFKNAIFGKECLLNENFEEIIDVNLDSSGLFSEKKELSKIVTGFFIFESRWDGGEKRRKLKASYINNPYAEVKIDPIIFLMVRHPTEK
jgi:hypothetical protein